MAKPWEKYQEPEEELVEEEEGPWTAYAPPTNFQEGIQDDVTMFGQIGEQGSRGVFDNLMNLPNAAGEVIGSGLAAATAGVQTIGTGIGEGLASMNFDLTTGEPLNLAEDFSRHYQDARNTFPASVLTGGMDAPTSLDAQAFAPSLMETAFQGKVPTGYDLTGTGGIAPKTEPREPQMLTPFGETFAQKRDEVLEGVLDRRAEHPIGAAGGDVLGDVATVLTGRVPYVSGQRATRLATPPAKPQKIDPGFRRWADRRVNDIQSWLKTSGLKMAETGLEGATMAALQDEDPLAAAAFGVGAQAVGNISQGVWDEIPGKRPTIKLAVGGIAATALWQVWKSLTPGGRDRILESEESAYDKMAAIVAVGAMTRMAGFSRPNQRQLDDLGAVVDSWHTMRRGAVMSLFSELENDDSGDMERVMMQLSQDPSFFSPTAQRRISRAATTEDVSMGNTIESLMEADRKFRRKVISLREGQQ
jgi:hypothetical protein